VTFRWKETVDPGRSTAANNISKMLGKFILKLLYQAFCLIQFISYYNVTVIANNISHSREYMQDKVLRVGIIHVNSYQVFISINIYNYTYSVLNNQILFIHYFIYLFYKYPPVINITKLPNGTTIYGGSSFDFLDYITSALNVR